jgi:hypothetical protein
VSNCVNSTIGVLPMRSSADFTGLGGAIFVMGWRFLRFALRREDSPARGGKATRGGAMKDLFPRCICSGISAIPLIG